LTNAWVTARTARLLGSRMRPWARPNGSLPNFAISPAARASANERCDGMVKTAGRSGILECRFRHRDRLRGADIEPQALVHGAKRPAFLDCTIPQDVRRKRALGRFAQQPLRDHLD